MKTFIYTVQYGRARKYGGCTVTVSVWQIKRNRPEFIGSIDNSSAAWKGERPTACEIISDKTGARMTNGYQLDSDQIQVIELQKFHK